MTPNCDPFIRPSTAGQTDERNSTLPPAASAAPAARPAARCPLPISQCATPSSSDLISQTHCARFFSTISCCCEHRQYKQGFKLLHAAILKHGPIPVLQTLLALCHAYTHAEADARALLKTLPPPGELDYTTFHTLLLVYRVLDDCQSQALCSASAS